MKKLIILLGCVLTFGILYGLDIESPNTAPALIPGNFGAGDWDFVTNSTVTVEGTGPQCFAADTPTLSVDCSANRVGIGVTNPTVTFEVVGGSIAVPASGNAGGPQYTFTGDTDTGLYNIGANILGLATAGSERVRVAADGNVGIGQATPASLLHLGDGTTDRQIRIDGTTNAQIIALDPNFFLDTSNASGQIIFRTGSQVEAARISAAGNVGINETTPDAALEVVDKAADAYALIVSSQDATTSLLVVDKAGNVGIGTASPAQKLDVVGQIATSNHIGITASQGTYNNTASANDTNLMMDLFSSNAGAATKARMRLRNNAGTGLYLEQVGGGFTGGTILDVANGGLIHSDGVGGITLNARGATGPLIFGTNDTEKMRISNGGNVGIGTASPGELLQVYRTAVNSSTATVANFTNPGTGAGAGATILLGYGANGNAGIAGLYDGTGDALAFFTRPTSGGAFTERARINASGNVGIGTTSPGALLDVRGGVLINSADQQASTFTATEGFLAPVPDAQTIAAGNTVAADACGGIKQITAGGAVTTDTTNTFTAPAVANKGCIMHVCNTGANNITLDNNANFKSIGGADIVLTADDCTIVGSTGSVWYSIGSLVAN